MDVSNITAAVPEYAKDLRLNLTSALSPGGSAGLSETQIAGTLLAASIATRNEALRDAIAEATQHVLEPAQQRAARAAASVMAMNNIYYRATHLIADREYAAMPAKLRMNVIGNPGVDKVDFEIYSLAVSAINGCGACLSAHEKVLRKSGIEAQGVQSTLRLAAIVNGIAVAMESGASDFAAAA